MFLHYTLRILSPQPKVPNDLTVTRLLLPITLLKATEGPNQPNGTMELPELVQDLEWSRLAIKEELLPGLVIAHAMM